MNIQDGYPQITDTCIFYTRILPGRYEYHSIRTRYTLIKIKKIIKTLIH